MEITTENITTYEPIISIVEIELEELTLGLYELWGRFCKSFLLIVNPSLKHKQKTAAKRTRTIHRYLKYLYIYRKAFAVR